MYVWRRGTAIERTQSVYLPVDQYVDQLAELRADDELVNVRRVKEGGKMADVKPEVKALCEELSGFKYEDCFAHNNVGFQDGSVTPAE